MVCEDCHGSGGIVCIGEDGWHYITPCPACTGGVASCCDGAVGKADDVGNQGPEQGGPGK
jgi:hypothetical protein